MSDPCSCPPTAHVIIAGYGIVGRAVAELLDRLDIPFCVVELNPSTVDRVHRGGTSIIAGDIRNEATLREAGIEHATTLALAMPDEKQVLAALQAARRLNPSVRIITRCSFSSAGMMATRFGADAVIVAEQVVAKEFARAVNELLPKSSNTHPT